MTLALPTRVCLCELLGAGDAAEAGAAGGGCVIGAEAGAGAGAVGGAEAGEEAGGADAGATDLTALRCVFGSAYGWPPLICEEGYGRIPCGTRRPTVIVLLRSSMSW